MRATLTAAALAALTGCGKPYNESIDLLGTAPLPALSQGEPGSSLRARVSLTRGFDRRHWGDVTVEVPTHQTASYPTYVAIRRLDETYPTAAAAVDDPAGAVAELADAAAQPAAAAGMLLAAPLRMLAGRWPWDRQRWPAGAHARAPAGGPPDLWDWFVFGPPRPPAIRWRQETAAAPGPPR